MTGRVVAIVVIVGDDDDEDGGAAVEELSAVKTAGRTSRRHGSTTISNLVHT